MSIDWSIGPVQPRKLVHLSRWTTFITTFPVWPNQFSLRLKFPVILVEWITTTVFNVNRWFTGMATKQEELSIFDTARLKSLAVSNYPMHRSLWWSSRLTEARPKQCKTRKVSHRRDHKTLNEVHFEIRMQTHSNCTKNKNDHNSRI